MASNEPSYELRPLSGPRLSGALLRKVFVPLLESPLLGKPLRTILLSKSGFRAFRASISTAELQSAPRARYPIHLPLPAPNNALDRHSAESCASFVADLDKLFLELSCARPPDAKLPGRFDSVRVLHDGYRNGSFTPLDVALDVLRRVEESNTGSKPLNAICRVDVDALVGEAQASTDRWQSGSPLSVLDGIPVAIKDSIDVRGIPTTGGLGYLVSPLCPSAAEDAGAVAALRRFGALVSIKSNMDEMGVGVRGFAVHNPLRMSFLLAYSALL
jgi:Amidase